MPMRFKFHPVNDDGQPQGLFTTRGAVDQESLTLGGDVIPIAAVADVDVRGKYLAVSVLTGENESGVITIYTSRAAELKSELGRLRSAVWAEMHRKHLTEQGQEKSFRQEDCPACGAVIDLSGFEPTPQIHCAFCHTISGLAGTDELGNEFGADPEKGFRLCDDCGMYSKPRQFTIFYFYFLLVFYGWHQRTTWRCPGCMRGDAWKMLFGNLFFLLGVPVALVQLFRCYGGTDIGGRFAGLDKANLRARNGELERAIEAYQGIMKKHPVSAGVKCNIGLALLQQDRIDQAARMFEFALSDCANYSPAFQVLAGCYNELGETEKLAALKKQVAGE